MKNGSLKQPQHTKTAKMGSSQCSGATNRIQ